MLVYGALSELWFALIIIYKRASPFICYIGLQPMLAYDALSELMGDKIELFCFDCSGINPTHIFHRILSGILLKSLHTLLRR